MRNHSLKCGTDKKRESLEEFSDTHEIGDVTRKVLPENQP